jgi:hypothetical protein
MRTLKLLFLSTLLASPMAMAKGDPKAPAPAKKPDAKAKPAPPKKIVPVSAEHKKALAELYAGFKFGTSKDDVIATLSKQIEERYADKLKGTTDVALQDRIRADRKREIDDVAKSYTKFEGKTTGWDVSMIDDEFAHNTGESMLARWENQDGENRRRFFFFSDGKLWKMFVLLDVSKIPEDKKNFATFRATMESKYGPSDADVGMLTWRTDEFNVRAVDKLKTYDALALVIEDPKVLKEVLATREAKAPKKSGGSSIVNSVIDKDGTDHPDVKQNNDAVNSVINAQGGPPPKKK